MGEPELISAAESVASGPGDLVVVGSSAGGVEALSIFVNTLPANFPAPIVLAQHLDPSQPSSLDAILQRLESSPGKGSTFYFSLLLPKYG